MRSKSKFLNAWKKIQSKNKFLLNELKVCRKIVIFFQSLKQSAKSCCVTARMKVLFISLLFLNSYFQHFIVLMILLNTLTLVLNDYSFRENPEKTNWRI